MIGRDGDELSVKVLDLGLAKLREMTTSPDAASELTVPGQRMGSPHYMSPEQWGVTPRDGDAAVDRRTDVYSLGVIAFEMLTGARPFDGLTTWELRGAHLAVEPQARDGVPAGVLRALAKDRADRPASAGEFIAAFGEPDVRAPSRPRTRVALTAVAAIAMASAATGFWFAYAPPASPPVAQVATVGKQWRAMTDAEQIAFVDERARAVSVALAGFEYHIPPDVRLGIKRAIDRYASRTDPEDNRIGHEELGALVARGRTYAPVLKSVFEREGVPPLIGIYLPMIESEYRPDAVSSMGARGMFQILPLTGRKYGATPADLDSVERSAPIAARYMHERISQFASDRMAVALGVAAYNLGPEDIEKYLNEVVVLDQEEAESRFWAAMAGSGFQTDEKGESSRYITQFFAAAIVGENPEAFGIAGPALSAAR
jgi:hypothetical protein